MNLKLTPGALASAYDYLRQTDPFKGWKLPPSAEIRFKVIQREDVYAEFYIDDDKMPVIAVSDKKNGHTVTVMASVGHEMIHMRQHLKGDREVHGKRYRRAAQRICAIHGFDLKVF